MSTRIVYLNGRYVPESEARVSIFDRGLLYGDAVYDVTRTFRGKPFRMGDHLDRLFRSLRYARIECPLTRAEIEAVSLRVLESSASSLGPNDDLFVTQRVSRGLRAPSDSGHVQSGATVVVYCEPIHFTRYARLYRTGAHLQTVSIRRAPPECLSPQAKVASKISLVLGELEVTQRDPDAYALLLGTDGFVAESTSSNVFVVRGDRLLTPRHQGILEGISRDTVTSLADGIGKTVLETDLTQYDVVNADEVFLTATSFCILPVTRVDGVAVGDGRPGRTTQALLEAWSKAAGLDIVAQALAHETS